MLITGAVRSLMDEWKASTDRSLANTESILRSLSGTRNPYTKSPPVFAGPSETSLAFCAEACGAAGASLSSNLKLGDLDRLFSQVKQELDLRCQAQDAKLVEFCKEVQGNLTRQIAALHDENSELKQRLNEESVDRLKLEKHISGLLRWQDGAKYTMEDLRREIEDTEETRGVDKRELRKELAKCEEKVVTAHDDLRRDVARLRSCGIDKVAVVGESGERTSALEKDVVTLSERCNKIEQHLAAASNTLDDHGDAMKTLESKLGGITEANAEMQAQVLEAMLVAEKLYVMVSDTKALQETVSKHDASIDRVQGMVREVVHVIGAMSSRLTEQLKTATDPKPASPAVASRVEELHMLYEERFKDITAMIRHIGGKVRGQSLSKWTGGSQEQAWVGTEGSTVEKVVVQRVMDELRKSRTGIDDDMAALRAFTQHLVGGEGDLWTLQDELATLQTQLGPMRQQLAALSSQVHTLGLEVSAMSDKNALLQAAQLGARESATLKTALDAVGTFSSEQAPGTSQPDSRSSFAAGREGGGDVEIMFVDGSGVDDDRAVKRQSAVGRADGIERSVGIAKQVQLLKVDDVLAHVNFNLTTSSEDEAHDKFDFGNT